MHRPVIACCLLALGSVGFACASAALPKRDDSTKSAPSKAVAQARLEAAALERAQNRAVASYKAHEARTRAQARREASRAAAVHSRTERSAKHDAAALAKAQDKAAANYRHELARRNSAQTIARKKAAAELAAAAKRAKQSADALARAQDQVVAHYMRSIGKGEPKAAMAVRRIENLACFTGIPDRHARIGVQLVNGKVDYFAYYSKWKPRTCSVSAGRDGPYSRWDDTGGTSRVTLIDNKGYFTIDRKGGTVRFVFHDIDRMRYCGMSGKINGSLTVVRGKSKCVIEGVMDNHEG